MKDEVLVWIANKRRVANIVLESHGRKGGGVGLDDSRFGHGRQFVLHSAFDV